MTDLIAQHVADGTHERAKSDPRIWETLQLNGRGCGLEFRTCPCTSTLAIVVDE